MRIAIQQTALGEAKIGKCFVRGRRAGAEGVGLCCDSADVLTGLNDGRAVSQLRSLMDRMGIPITGLHLGILCREASLIGTARQIAQTQELVGRAIAVAGQLGRCNVIVPFFGRNRIELPEEFERAARALSELVDTAEEHGVTLAVESSLHIEQLHRLLTRCSSDSVQACLDTGDVTACRHDPVSMILALGAASIAQVHMKDVRIISGLAPDFNVRLGHGSVRWTSLVSALHTIGYKGWVVLETPPGDDRGAIAAANVAYAKQMLRVGPVPVGIP